MLSTQETPTPGLPTCDSDSAVCWECQTSAVTVGKSVCRMLSPPQAVSVPWQRLSPLLFTCHQHHLGLQFHDVRQAWLAIGAEVLGEGTLRASVLNTGSYWVSLSSVQSMSILSLQNLSQSSLFNPKMRCPLVSIAALSLSRDGCWISLIMKWPLCIVF